MEHTSIFEKVKNYKSDPAREYNKIISFLKNEMCSYKVPVLKVLKEHYSECPLLPDAYPSFDECVLNNCRLLESIGPYDYETLSDKDKEEVLDEFLLFCEIVLFCYHHIYNAYMNDEIEIEYYDFNRFSFSRTDSIISKSLNSINYQYKVDKGGAIKVSKINPIAEGISHSSSHTLKESIESYLAVRNGDIKGKTTVLLEIINLLEPTLKKYENQPLVGKAKEYSQLLRHPEVYKVKEDYKWFYGNEKKYLDDLFNLCLFAQQYATANGIVNLFDNNKKL